MGTLHRRFRCGYHRSAILAVTTAVLLSSSAVRADVVSDFTGFTRPGAPADSRSGGKVRFIADIEKYRDEAVGATVYFMVLERTGNDQDPWGIGLQDATKRFQPGIDADGAFSPGLDQSAEYLYLYQVVNDRKTFQAIQSAAIEIKVDMKEITSWGYFGGLGFGTILDAQRENASKIRSVSFNHSPGTSDLSRMFASPAPPITHQLGTVLVPTEKGQVKPRQSTHLVQVSWDALDPARDPSLVMLVADPDDRDFKKSTGSLRAIWNGERGLEKDQRSTVFGFTSPRKPHFVPVRIHAGIEEKEKKQPKSKVRLIADAVNAAGLENTGVSAEGRVPSPFSVATVANEPVDPGLPPPPILPPNPPLLPPAPAVASGGSPGAVGSGFPGVGGGFGGTALGFPGGGGGSTQSDSQGGTQQTQGDQQEGDQTINFIATLINQQSQSQAQAQFQKQLQSQRQRQKNGNGGNGGGKPAVAAPGTWLLASMGLPVLLWMRRRKLRRGRMELNVVS